MSLFKCSQHIDTVPTNKAFILTVKDMYSKILTKYTFLKIVSLNYQGRFRANYRMDRCV